MRLRRRDVEGTLEASIASLSYALDFMRSQDAAERVIERALQKLLAGRTAFVIAHRLSTIQSANLIVVLAHGQIVEQGTHAELMQRGGAYRSLYGDWAAEVA